MYAQVLFFNGPRSADLVAAAERARRERIAPAMEANPQIRAAHRGTYVLQGADGAEVVVTLADSEAIFEVHREVAMSTELLPGEDPALLPGPDRVERYEVIAAYDADFSDRVTAP